MIAVEVAKRSIAIINGIRSFVAVSPVQSTNVPSPTIAEMRQDTADALTWLTARLGPFPYPDTGAIVVSGGDSAMETAGRPTYSNNSGYDFSPEVVVHELAHEWFGGRLTAQNVSDVWIHEAFATWLERYWQSQQPGGEALAPHLRRNYLLDGFDPRRNGQFDKVSVEAPTNAYRLESTVYYRGAMALEALRQQIGATAFGKVLRTLAQQPAGHAFTTSQVVALAQQASGQDLTGWRATWISSTGAQQPPAHASAQTTADELARYIGYQVYEASPSSMTPSDLLAYIQQTQAAYSTYLPLELVTAGHGQLQVYNGESIVRAELDVPAGLYGAPVHACLTFPSDVAGQGDPGAWFGAHTPLSADPTPDTVTLSPCPGVTPPPGT